MSDLRVQKTEMLLCDALLALLSEKDFDTVTVGELCDRAMVRRATFYKHFTDKYDFLTFFIHREESSILQGIDTSDPVNYCVELFRRGALFLLGHIDLVRNAVNSHAYSVVVNTLCGEMHKSVTKSIVTNWNTSEKDAETQSSFFVGGSFFLLRQWLEDKDRCPLEELTERVRAVIGRIPT